MNQQQWFEVLRRIECKNYLEENKVKRKACNFIKKEALAQMFSCEFCEISKSTFSYITPLIAASAHFNNKGTITPQS